MRIRLRRCPHMLRECLIKVLAYVLVGVSICHRNIYAVLGVLFFTLFLWWSLGDSSGCNGPQIVEQVCREYREKYVSGSLCPDLCTSKELTIGSCYSNKDHVMSFSKGGLVFRVVSNPLEVWQQDRLDEGLEFGQFTAHLDELLREQLGKIDTTSLINQLIFDFDDNKDDKINLGEAQNIWRLLKQPYFLNYYLFQDSGSVPHLNGTCGGISIWHYYPLFSGKALYSKTTPWPVSLFTNHAYRWTLPGWLQRAKVMLSLVELVEDLYEKDGVRCVHGSVHTYSKFQQHGKSDCY